MLQKTTSPLLAYASLKYHNNTSTILYSDLLTDLTKLNEPMVAQNIYPISPRVFFHSNNGKAKYSKI